MICNVRRYELTLESKEHYVMLPFWYRFLTARLECSGFGKDKVVLYFLVKNESDDGRMCELTPTKFLIVCGEEPVDLGEYGCIYLGTVSRHPGEFRESVFHVFLKCLTLSEKPSPFLGTSSWFQFEG